MKTAIGIVNDPAMEQVGANLLALIGLCHHVPLDAAGRAQCFKLPRHGVEMLGPEGTPETSVAPELALDALFLEEAVEEFDKAEALPQDRVCPFLAISLFHAKHAELVETRADHPAIARAGAITEPPRLEQHDRLPRPRLHERRMQTGEPGADDGDIDPARKLDFFGNRPRRGIPPVGGVRHILENGRH